MAQPRNNEVDRLLAELDRAASLRDRALADAAADAVLAEFDENAALRERLQATPARPAVALNAALLAGTPRVSAAEWARVWAGVSAAPAQARSAPAAAAGSAPVLLRLGRPLSALAAALVLTVGLWRGGSPRAEAGWPLQVAANVEVSDLEVFDEETPLVFAGGVWLASAAE